MNPEQLLHQARVALDQSRYAESVEAYERVVGLSPGNAPVLAELAFAYAQARRLDDAERLASQVIAQAPQSGFAWSAQGIAEFRRGRHDRAIEPLERAVEFASGLHPARQALGICYAAVGRREESRRCHETILLLQPNHAEARLSLATADLAAGDFRNGWLGYEARWLTKQVGRREIPRPQWDGRDLAGKAIMVHTEQALGDAVQMMKLVPLLKSTMNAGRVVLAFEPAIQKLFEHSLPGVEWLPYGVQTRINFDVYCPVFSLPGLLEITGDTIPPQREYLTPDPARVERWKPAVTGLPGFRIGLGWQGNPGYPDDSLRSFPLSELEPLAKIPGVTLVSLQKIHGTEQIAANKDRVPVVEWPGLDVDGVFLDTAAVLRHLDLVITCDSALAHVAGASGVPTFLALALGHDWRWQHARDDSPWYPSLRLFRQTAYRQWDDVFERIAAHIRSGLANPKELFQ